MATDHSKYPKQPENPERKEEDSVTWVRNWNKVGKRRVVYVPKPAFRPKGVK